MPGSVRSNASKRSSNKRRRGPSSVKSDEPHSIRKKRNKADIHLGGKVLGYISELPSRSGNGTIIVRRMEDFRLPQFKDLETVHSYLKRTGKWPASRDQDKAVSEQFANIVNKKREYRALGLKWKWPGRSSKVPGEVKMLDSSELDDLVLLDIEVRDGEGYARNLENISADIRLSIPEERTQETRNLKSKLEDAWEERVHLKAQLNKAKGELDLTPEDCMDRSKPESDYRNGFRRCMEIRDSRVKKAPARIAKVKAALENNWETIISLERILGGDYTRHDAYDQSERGRPRQRMERPRQGTAYGYSNDPYEGSPRYARAESRSEMRRPSFTSRSFSMFPGADTPPAMFDSRSRSRSRTPAEPRTYSRMSSYNDWHTSKPYFDPGDVNDEGYFSRANSRSRSRAPSLSRPAYSRRNSSLPPRTRRSSIWSTDSFPPPRSFGRSRSDSFSSRSSSMPRQPSFYGGHYGGPPPLSRAPSRSGNRGGGYRRQYVSDSGSVVNEEAYNEGGWNVRIVNSSNTTGGGRNRSLMSRRSSVFFH